MEHSISFLDLPFFSKLVKDYWQKDANLNHLLSFEESREGVLNATEQKLGNYKERQTFLELLPNQYKGVDISSKVKENISSLSNEHTFVITTAHQPNLFLGPLYTITKAISAISTCRQMNEFQNKFVYIPVYVIGSEDHDKEELLNVQLFGKKYEWQTAQTGPIGSMIIDDTLTELLDVYTGSFGNTQHALELQNIYRKSYQKGKTIADATFSMLNELLGHEGLIIVDLNKKEVKARMKNEFTDELKNNIAISKTKETLGFLSSKYKIQASPREINLFLLKERDRKRIEASTDQLLELLQDSPESFSPNVMLRPLMQQKILPSVANIGGAAEVAYWMELKELFDYFKVDFPVLVMRDIILFIDEKSNQRWINWSLDIADFFISEEALKKKIALKDSNWVQYKEQAIIQMNTIFDQLKNTVEKIDKTLVSSVEAEWIKSLKSVDFIDNKVLKAEKRKVEELTLKLEKVKSKIYFQNVLFERKENFASYYIKHGREMFDHMLQKSDVFEKKLKILIQ